MILLHFQPFFTSIVFTVQTKRCLRHWRCRIVSDEQDGRINNILCIALSSVAICSVGMLPNFIYLFFHCCDETMPLVFFICFSPLCIQIIRKFLRTSNFIPRRRFWLDNHMIISRCQSSIRNGHFAFQSYQLFLSHVLNTGRQRHDSQFVKGPVLKKNHHN